MAEGRVKGFQPHAVVGASNIQHRMGRPDKRGTGHRTLNPAEHEAVPGFDEFLHGAAGATIKWTTAIRARFILIKLAHPGFGRKVPLAKGAWFTRCSNAPQMGCCFTSYSLHCNAGAAMAALKQTVNEDQKEQSYGHNHSKNSVFHFQRTGSPEFNTKCDCQGHPA
jgi:hypothetical protein